MCSPIARRMRDERRPRRRPPARVGSGSGSGGTGTRCAAAPRPLPRARLDGGEHVLLAHAAAAARARHRVEVDSVLRRDAPHDRRERRRARRLGRRPGVGLGLRRARRACGSPGRRPVVDPRQQGLDRHGRPRPRRGSPSPGRSPAPGTSESILSVEISQIVSSASTQSPTLLGHSTTVPSATETPICGIVTSTRLSSRGAQGTPPSHGRRRQDRLFQRRRERDRHVRRGHPHDRAVEVLEASLGDQRCDLRAGGAGRLASSSTTTFEQRAPSRGSRRSSSGTSERRSRTSTRAPSRSSVGLQRGVHHRAVGDHRRDPRPGARRGRSSGSRNGPRPPRP